MAYSTRTLSRKPDQDLKQRDNDYNHIEQEEQQKLKKEIDMLQDIEEIIAKIQGEHISSLPESQQIKNQTHTQIKQENDCCYETAYSTRAFSRKQDHQDLKQRDND